MSTIPRVDQIRQPLDVSGDVPKWLVTTRVIDKGDLPVKELFVLTITDPANPKSDKYLRVAAPQELHRLAMDGPVYIRVQTSDVVEVGADTFARVASIDDVTSLPTDRSVAVRQGRSLYLASSVTFLYDNVTTADAAYRALLARLSSLTTDWRTVTESFVTTPSQVYELPTTTATEESARTLVYRSAVANRKALEATRDRAVTDAADCDRSCTLDNALYNMLVADISFLQTAKSHVLSLSESGTTNVRTYVLNGADATSYEALLAAKRSALAPVQVRVQTGQARCSTLDAAARAAQTAVDAARTAENTALGAVLAICPTFVP